MTKTTCPGVGLATGPEPCISAGPCFSPGLSRLCLGRGWESTWARVPGLGCLGTATHPAAPAQYLQGVQEVLGGQAGLGVQKVPGGGVGYDLDGAGSAPS